MRIVIIVLALSALRAEGAEDWPQWRGPHRDGRLAGIKLPAKFPAKLGEEWKVEVGEGLASPISAGGKVFIFARQGEEEAVLCLDPAGGRQIWRSAYAAPYEPDPAARSHGKGPKSTPAIAGKRIYTFGISGILSAFNLEDGAPVWRKEFAKD